MILSRVSGVSNHQAQICFLTLISCACVALNHNIYLHTKKKKKEEEEEEEEEEEAEEEKEEDPLELKKD